GGRTVVDLGDVSHLDSSGLGALVGLKASAIRPGFCILAFANLTARILERLRITNLTQLFSSWSLSPMPILTPLKIAKLSLANRGDLAACCFVSTTQKTNPCLLTPIEPEQKGRCNFPASSGQC